jgi:hypothetical protein
VIRGFFDFMAKMGLSVRDDPPRVVDLSIRQFGETRDGLALSILQIPLEDREALASVSVVLRNVSQEPKAFTIPGWLAFYRMEVRLPDGSPAGLKPFGRALANAERRKESLNVTLAPGALNETEVPLGSIFNLRAGVGYTVKAFCEPGGTLLESNEIVVR